MSIVGGAAAVGNSSDLGIKTLLEPVLGLETSYQFVRAAATVVERRQRIATLASFLATSAASITTDPSTNIAVGTAVASKINYMKAILTRGGAISNQITKPISSLKNFALMVDSVKTPVLEVHPYRAKFTANCKISINNMFQDHTARRYIQGSAQKIRSIAPTYLVPICSTQINTTALIGWTFFGVGLIGFTTLGALYLFQHVERKRSQNQNTKIVIDVTPSPSD